MMHCEDLKVLESCLASSCHRTIIAKECRDEYGLYWRLKALIVSQLQLLNEFTIVNADSYDELMVWCDMHNIKVESIERLDNE